MLLVRVFEIGVLAVTKIRPNPLHHLALLGFGEYAGSAGDPVVVITRIECVLAPVKAPPLKCSNTMIDSRWSDIFRKARGVLNVWGGPNWRFQTFHFQYKSRLERGPDRPKNYTVLLTSTLLWNTLHL